MSVPAVRERGDRPAGGRQAPVVSVRTGLAPRYPQGSDAFSPSSPYPESPFTGLSARPNAVYEAVREVMRQAGLDEARAGQPEWNPLGDYIRPGDRVFVLCNFVHHRTDGESEERFQAKCTHASVLRPVLDYALLAAGREGRVRFGNAPLQACDWRRVLDDTGASALPEFYARHGYDVQACDLRQIVSRYDRLGRRVSQQRRPDTRPGLDFDLGSRSLLNGLAGGKPRYRVTDYDPQETEACHAGDKHVYRVSREILDADVVISLPKLKTHEKVGLTCGLKGFVGAIASKHCLAHHRYGGPREGGDEYARATAGARLGSWMHDRAQRWQDSRLGRLMQLLDVSWRRFQRRTGKLAPGAWHGNDTCWRMTLDIAAILHHLDRQGQWHDEPCRRHLLFVDGVIGGQGEGPLNPTPAPSGLVLFADDIATGDRACCELIGFDPDRIPLVRDAGDRWTGATVVTNGRLRRWDELAGRPEFRFEPPPGWAGHVERRRPPAEGARV